MSGGELLRARLPAIKKRAELTAEERAAEVLDDARRAADAIRDEAEDDYATWRAQAMAEAEEAVREEISEALVSAIEAERRAIRRIEQAVVPLVLRATARLMRETTDAEPELVLPIVQDAIAELALASRVSVSVAPVAVAPLREALSEDARVTVREDASLASGEARVETDIGEVDATFKARLGSLERALRDSRG